MTLAEDALPAIVSLLNHLDRMVLAHCHQAHPFGQSLLDAIYPFTYHF